MKFGIEFKSIVGKYVYKDISIHCILQIYLRGTLSTEDLIGGERGLCSGAVSTVLRRKVLTSERGDAIVFTHSTNAYAH